MVLCVKYILPKIIRNSLIPNERNSRPICRRFLGKAHTGFALQIRPDSGVPGKYNPPPEICDPPQRLFMFRADGTPTNSIRRPARSTGAPEPAPNSFAV